MSEILAYMYNTLVRPQLEYAAPIVGPSYKQKIFQTQSCQMINNNHNRSSAIAMLQYLGWWTLEQRQAGANPCLLSKIVINL